MTENNKEYNLEPNELSVMKELRKKIIMFKGEFDPDILKKLEEKKVVNVVPLTSETYELTTLGYTLASEI